MSKMLADGEYRVMKSRIKNRKFEVVAQRVDSETPYISLRGHGINIYLTDTEAIDVLERIKRALSILPSSK